MSAWASIRAKSVSYFGLRYWHVWAWAGALGLIFAVLIVGAFMGVVYLRGLSRQETQRNAAVNRAQQQSIANLRRIQRLEKPPTDRELALAASNALRVCVADAACRRRLRGAIRRTNLRPSDVPSLVPRPSSDTGSGGTGAGGGTGGNSTGTGGNSGGTTSPGGPDTTRRPTSPAPSRPPVAPSAPAPRPPAAPPPTARPPREPTPVTPSTPIPVPRPPPPTPTVPPVTTPPVVPPVQVCTPVIQVNCRDPQSGRVVGPNGAAADPGSNGGRGNRDEPLCERVKAPCDAAGNPVFPPGLLPPLG